MNSCFISIEKAIAELQQGRMIILVDSEDRENEGDLVVAAEFATAEVINFMSRFGRGLICLPMAPHLIDKLGLSMMAERNRSPYGTAFTVSIEAASGVTTGISAYDRARTVQVAIAAQSGPKDIISPGHMFPLRANSHGVIKRAGQTEGSIDLMHLAGLTEAAVICEIINDDGSMSRRDDLIKFSQKHNISIVTIKDLIDYRIRNEILIEEIAKSRLPLQKRGEFSMYVFRNQLDEAEHFALVRNLTDEKPPLVRIHSECITGDVLGSLKCDCGFQLQHSLELISKEGGILIYLRQEGRGIGLANKLKAYALQEQGYDTVEANVQLGLPIDARNYAVAYQVLKYFSVNNIRLLTNNPYKVKNLEKYGIKVSERIALKIKPTNENLIYLKTKQQKLGHLLDIE